MEPYSILTGICVVALRKDSGLTVNQFADKIGYTKARMLKVEEAPSKPITLRLEYKLREAFGLADNDIMNLCNVANAKPFVRREVVKAPIQTKPRNTHRVLVDLIETGALYSNDDDLLPELKPFIQSVAHLLEKPAGKTKRYYREMFPFI